MSPPEERIKTDVIVFGASGHAKVVIDIVEKQNIYKLIGLVDDNSALKGKDVFSYSVIGGKDEMNVQGCKQVLVAIGDNQVRVNIASWLELNDFILAEAIVHPSAQLSRGVSIGAGSVVMAGSVVNADSSVGKNTIINTGAIVDHDCVVGEAVHVAPGSIICGGVSIGNLSLIGAGAVVHPNVKIGRNVTVGAGSTVLKDVADGVSVVGSPAVVISSL